MALPDLTGGRGRRETTRSWEPARAAQQLPPTPRRTELAGPADGTALWVTLSPVSTAHGGGASGVPQQPEQGHLSLGKELAEEALRGGKTGAGGARWRQGRGGGRHRHTQQKQSGKQDTEGEKTARARAREINPENTGPRCEHLVRGGSWTEPRATGARVRRTGSSSGRGAPSMAPSDALGQVRRLGLSRLGELSPSGTHPSRARASPSPRVSRGALGQGCAGPGLTLPAPDGAAGY